MSASATTGWQMAMLGTATSRQGPRNFWMLRARGRCWFERVVRLSIAQKGYWFARQPAMGCSTSAQDPA